MYVFYSYIYIHISYVYSYLHLGQMASSTRDKASVQKMIGDWAGSHGEDDGGTDMCIYVYICTYIFVSMDI
jgi:hypothetical protein